MGICLMNSLLEVLCSMLNNRLVEHAKQLLLFNSEQIGFQENASTSGHILVLKTLVNKYVTDFKKSFDSMKLENNNINGNFLYLLLYSYW